MEIAMQVICGLGLFIYGMNLMGEGLQKAAGTKLKAIVGALTKSTLRGIVVGALVTAIIQSSSATTVMVVGFVNAGIMTLKQAFGVIMGANIGTTMTGIIIALNISKYAPLLVGVGTLLFLISKTKLTKAVGEAVLGFGLLFLGMLTMEGGLRPLGESPIFSNMMATLNSPLLGLMVGFLVTAIVQSSSAVIGIIQALGLQGLISIGQAFPILLGSNIGSTMTAVLSSVGAHRTAKRAALIHFLFNFIGSIIFLILFVFLRAPFVHFMESVFPSLPAQIAMSHLGFNTINTILMYPFADKLVSAAEKIIPGVDGDNDSTIHLDERLLKTPSIALGQALSEIKRMAGLAEQSLRESHALILEGRVENYNKIMERELLINAMQKEITGYLIELGNAPISDVERIEVDDLLYMISDIERVGDHVKNICELQDDIESERIVFSELGIKEMEEMFVACEKIFPLAVRSFVEKNLDDVNEVFTLEDEVDKMEEEFRLNHIKRLANKYADAAPGIIFLDCISNLERISDHSNNIATYVANKHNFE
ncbi:MAG: Na/Pi cotransporter family protein [Ezakiella sp.]|nr:Na/Pi cotransporter family protein [Ezakiella sp.]